MKLLKNSVSVLLSVLLAMQAVSAANSYSIPSGGSARVTEYDSGYVIRNSGAYLYFVPTNTRTEFDSFRNAVPRLSGLSICSLAGDGWTNLGLCSADCDWGNMLQICDAACGGSCGGYPSGQYVYNGPACNNGACCSPQNGYWGNWGSCFPYSGSCGLGIQYGQCLGAACGGWCPGSGSQSCLRGCPSSGQTCVNNACCTPTAYWVSDYSVCSNPCGPGLTKKTCVGSCGGVCSGIWPIGNVQYDFPQCTNYAGCTYSWSSCTSPIWDSANNKYCGPGTRNCIRSDGTTVAASYCGGSNSCIAGTNCYTGGGSCSPVNYHPNNPGNNHWWCDPAVPGSGWNFWGTGGGGPSCGVGSPTNYRYDYRETPAQFIGFACVYW